MRKFILAISAASMFFMVIILTWICDQTMQSVGVSITGSPLGIKIYKIMIGNFIISPVFVETIRPYLGVSITGPQLEIAAFHIFQIVINALKILIIVRSWQIFSSPK